MSCVRKHFLNLDLFQRKKGSLKETKKIKIINLIYHIKNFKKISKNITVNQRKTGQIFGTPFWAA